MAGRGSADGHIGQRFTRLVPLARQSRNHPCRRVVLIQRRAELLSRLRQLLLERVCFEHNGVPLVLENAEQRRDRREIRRPRRDDLWCLELDEILNREIFPRDRIRVVFCHVSLDQPFFEHIAALARSNGVPGSFS